MTIKTVSDFKKALQIGVMLHCTHHQKSIGRDEKGYTIYASVDMGVRPVSIKQSNSFALKTVRTDGKEVDSWCSYPKASQCIIKDNAVTILEEDCRVREDIRPLIPILTYTFI